MTASQHAQVWHRVATKMQAAARKAQDEGAEATALGIIHLALLARSLSNEYAAQK